jgi:hypothetical protein
VGNLGRKKPQTKTITAIKVYLRSIYRNYINLGKVKGDFRCEILYENELLDFSEPKILTAPFWSSKNGPEPGEIPQYWRENFNFELSSGTKISGWVGILETMNRDLSGFFMHYRGKGIAGVVPINSENDDLEVAKDSISRGAYKPRRIFKQTGSYPDQSLIGEFDISEFGKTITTDSPLWTVEEENEFIELLFKELSKENMNFIRMTECFRRRKSQLGNLQFTPRDEEEEASKVRNSLDGVISHKLPSLENANRIDEKSLDDVDGSQDPYFFIDLNDLEGHSHKFEVRIMEDRSSDFLVIQEGNHSLHHKIYINMHHPVFDDLILSKDTHRAIRRIAVSIASSEVFLTGWDRSQVRLKMNEILRRISQKSHNG